MTLQLVQSAGLFGLLMSETLHGREQPLLSTTAELDVPGNPGLHQQADFAGSY